MRQHRMYSIYGVKTVNGRKRYHRLSDLQMSLAHARAFWQNMLLSTGLDGSYRELRPVKFNR